MGHGKSCVKDRVIPIHPFESACKRQISAIVKEVQPLNAEKLGIRQSEGGQPDPINIVLQLNGVGIKRSHANSKSRQRGLGSEISRASAHHKNVRTKGQERVGHSDNFCVRDAYKGTTI